MTYYIEIVVYATGDVVERIGPHSNRRGTEHAERGVNINLCHDRYYTRVVEVKE